MTSIFSAFWIRMKWKKNEFEKLFWERSVLESLLFLTWKTQICSTKLLLLLIMFNLGFINRFLTAPWRKVNLNLIAKFFKKISHIFLWIILYNLYSLYITFILKYLNLEQNIQKLIHETDEPEYEYRGVNLSYYDQHAAIFKFIVYIRKEPDNEKSVKFTRVNVSNWPVNYVQSVLKQVIYFSML